MHFIALHIITVWVIIAKILDYICNEFTELTMFALPIKYVDFNETRSSGFTFAVIAICTVISYTLCCTTRWILSKF